MFLLYINHLHDDVISEIAIYADDTTLYKILGLTFSSKLDWGSYIISVAKTVPKKIGALIHSMKFLSPEVSLYLYRTPIHGILLLHLGWCP